jgi:hypothetical protein
MECPYPDLFDPDKLQCSDFTKTKCNSTKKEPQAPCKIYKCAVPILYIKIEKKKRKSSGFKFLLKQKISITYCKDGVEI